MDGIGCSGGAADSHIILLIRHNELYCKSLSMCYRIGNFARSILIPFQLLDP